MRYGFSCVIALGAAAMLAAPALADTVIYNNLTPNNSMAIASRPDTSAFEIETETISSWARKPISTRRRSLAWLYWALVHLRSHR
jgi:hypothetical protein